MDKNLESKIDLAVAEIKKYSGRKICAQFSGGKDSSVVLHILSYYTDEPFFALSNDTGDHVAWMNQYIIDFCKEYDIEMYWAKPETPVTEWLKEQEVLPSPILFNDIPQRNYGLISIFDCCWRNRYKPLDSGARGMGADVIMRGTRYDDPHRIINSGDGMGDGVMYVLPLKDWTEDDVFAYIEAHDIKLPAQYYTESKYLTGPYSRSFDCAACPAFTNPGEILRVEMMQELDQDGLKRLGSNVQKVCERIHDYVDEYSQFVNVVRENVDG